MSSRRSRKQVASADRAAKESGRSLKKEKRGMGRELRKLEKEEQTIINKMKAAHKRNDLATCKQLAKDLMRTRNMMKRMHSMTSKLTSLEHRTKQMATTLKMTTAVQTASAAMSRINAAIDPQSLSAMMQQFSRANDRMNVTEEMMDDMLDTFDDADESEVDAVTQGVLEEIGIEFENTLPQAKAGSMPAVARNTGTGLKTGDAATDALLAELGV